LLNLVVAVVIGYLGYKEKKNAPKDEKDPLLGAFFERPASAQNINYFNNQGLWVILILSYNTITFYVWNG